jgi:hypothetical protein
VIAQENLAQRVSFKEWKRIRTNLEESVVADVMCDERSRSKTSPIPREKARSSISHICHADHGAVLYIMSETPRRFLRALAAAHSPL